MSDWQVIGAGNPFIIKVFLIDAAAVIRHLPFGHETLIEVWI